MLELIIRFRRAVLNPVETAAAYRRLWANSGRNEQIMSKASSKERAEFWDQISALYPLVRDNVRVYDDVKPALQRIIEGEFGPAPTASAGSAADEPDSRFVSPELQVENLQRWNDEFDLGIPKKWFEQLGVSPVAPDERLVVVTLVPYLKGKRGVSGVQRTFDALWKITASVQPNDYRGPLMQSDSEHLRLLEGIEHEPGLRWEVIDLGVNKDQAPKAVRDPSNSAHAGVLATAAHHPEYVQAQNGNDVPYLWLPGYQVNVDGGAPWRSVPYLYWIRICRRVRLSADRYDARRPGDAVPVLREYQS